jgi:hypothetical protein
MHKGLRTQSSMDYSPTRNGRDSYDLEEGEFDALPTIEEMAANRNYMKNLQPFDMMDRDLRYLVDELKAQKKSKWLCGVDLFSFWLELA